MDSLFSFPVGLFHPLQHAGLSRRSPSGRRTEFISDMCLLPIGCEAHGAGIAVLVEFRRIWQEL
jgi:hypothetical protein